MLINRLSITFWNVVDTCQQKGTPLAWDALTVHDFALSRRTSQKTVPIKESGFLFISLAFNLKINYSTIPMPERINAYILYDFRIQFQPQTFLFINRPINNGY